MQIAVDGDGQEPAVVLVHSLLTDWRAFDLIVPALCQRRRVVRVSLPGFGDTPALDIEDPSIFDLADTVTEALDIAEVGDDAAVVGNGLGAFVVTALAVANGGAVFAAARRGAFTPMSELVGSGGMEAVVDVAVKRIFTAPYLAANPGVIAERREVLVETDPRAFSAACLALRDMDLTDRVGAITNPTLVIAGGADQTTPPEMARELSSAIPGATFVELEGCGHCPPLEQPAAFANAIETFLDDLAQRTDG